MEDPAIRVENLGKTFGWGKKRVHAVDDISFEVQPAQVYGFLGPNGAGKSTTIRMILNLINPTSGNVYLFGEPLNRRSRMLNNRVGGLVDGAMFYGYLTGRKNLEVLARTSGTYDANDVDRVLQLVGMTDRADRRVREYSTGMKQRLGIAAVLLGDPDLIILDEPVNGLDPRGIQEIRILLRKLVDEYGKTVFLSSHLLSEIEMLCDRVAIINRGKLMKEGAVSDLLSDQVVLQIEARPKNRAVDILSEHWSASLNGSALITVNAPAVDAPEVVRTLTAHDIDVFQVISHRLSLEDYFLSITGENDHD